MGLTLTISQPARGQMKNLVPWPDRCGNPAGSGDAARHAGSPDRGDAGQRPGPCDSYWAPDADVMAPEALARVKSRDFH
jgi:hypothetical protein